MLEVKQIKKSFGAKTAVKGVSFSIGAGEIFSLIGPNGSGKTTIVKLVAGLLRLDAGAISVGGTDPVADPIAAKKMIGYVPDEPTAWTGMTGLEFLHFVGALYGMPEDARKRRIAELLPLFKFDGVEREYFEDYSRGNKQKFVILAALLHEPRLLLVDEPMVGLDPESATTTKKIFRDFVRGGGTIFLVTHTLSLAEEISSRIGVLKKGELVFAGTIAELRDKTRRGADAPLEELYAAINV